MIRGMGRAILEGSVASRHSRCRHGESGQSLLGGVHSSYPGRRFSMDVGEDEFLLNNGTPGLDYLQPTIQLPSSKGSLNGSLLPAPLPARRRASTSSALFFGSNLGGDDSFFGDPYDGDPFESSQGTSFSPLSRRPALQPPAAAQLALAGPRGPAGFQCTLRGVLAASGLRARQQLSPLQ